MTIDENRMHIGPIFTAASSALKKESSELSAFADEFERRLTKETKLAEKIAKAVRPHGELITGVFFDVDGGEEVTRRGPEDTYTLEITILHAADPDFDVAAEAAQAAANAIEKAFKDKLFR